MDKEVVEKNMHEIINCFPNPFYIIDDDDRIIYCNEAALRVFDYAEKEELAGLRPYELSPLVQPDGKYSVTKGKEMLEIAKEKRSHNFFWVHKKRNGEEFAAEVFLLYRDGLTFAEVLETGMLEQLRNERIKMKEEMNKLIYKDYITELHNEISFKRQLALLIEKSRKRKEQFALLFVDFDKLNTIIDALGYQARDEIIRETARRLKQVVPRDTFIARCRKDNFALLVYGPRSREELRNIAKTILHSFDKACYIHHIGNYRDDIYLSASIGIALYPFDGEDADTLFKNATLAMDDAKEADDDDSSIRFFTKQMEQKAAERFLIENQLRKALASKEFCLYYHPVVNIGNNKIAGAETLLRWENTKLGFVAPEKFISIAEETKMIYGIGEYVLQKACESIKRLEKKGCPIPLAVNISVKQLEKRNFVRKINDIIRRYGINTRYLEFEITESVSAGNMKKIKQNLNKIKELGIRISMDDFGTGYSSFEMLLNFQVNKIKIDKSFVQGIKSVKEEKVIRAITSMAKELKMQVVAEGIETEEQLRFVKDLGCEYGQGYLFYKPMPEDLFFRLVRTIV
ncbi:MAG: phosphodiesterase [Firmicutes bacterium]|nr:phosphodiesterase [Bacillota bacterium]